MHDLRIQDEIAFCRISVPHQGPLVTHGQGSHVLGLRHFIQCDLGVTLYGNASAVGDKHLIIKRENRFT